MGAIKVLYIIIIIIIIIIIKWQKLPVKLTNN